MKLAVVGSRDGFDEIEVRFILDGILAMFDSVTVVSGGARGVDTYAKNLVETTKQEFMFYKEFPANWDTHGKSAGFIRNKEIVDACDKLIAFQYNDSKGTQHSIDLAKKAGKLWMVVKKYE